MQELIKPLYRKCKIFRYKIRNLHFVIPLQNVLLQRQLRQMYIMFLIPASWQTSDVKNELLLKPGREILPREFLPQWTATVTDIKTKNFLTEISKSWCPYGEITHLLLGNNVKNSLIKKYNSIFTKIITWLRFQSRSIISYYHLPLPPGPLRGFLPPSGMEDYFVIEFSVYGGNIGPLSMSTYLGHRHLLGSRL